MKQSKVSLPKKLLFIAVLIAVLELLLRYGFGFGTIPIYYSSKYYEYALAPDQDMVRFGNRFKTNELGMRSAPLSENEVRVLKFGDSVINGGVATDHKELASSIMEKNLQGTVPGSTLRVLNVSNGSWGPDNAFAWMEQHGDQDAKLIVLVFSSHDWQDQMTFRDVVGRVPFYPDRQPLTAISDFASWVWSRKLERVNWNDLPYLIDPPVAQEPFNTGWEHFYRYCLANDIHLLVYHHPSRKELADFRYDENGHLLDVFLEYLGVPVINGLMEDFSVEDYRDDVHLSASGQAKLAQALEPAVKYYLSLENGNAE